MVAIALQVAARKWNRDISGGVEIRDDLGQLTRYAAPMLALSSCWNNSRHTDGEAMIEEIVKLGFERIELSHGMTISKLPGIRKAWQRGLFRCCGIHNYFPSPVEVMIDAPDAFEFTSHRPHDRKRAMDMSLRSLEMCDEFEAAYLVLHMGSVPMNPKKWTKPLTAMVADGRQHHKAFIKRKHSFLKKREKIAPLYYQRALEALETLAERAAELGVKLAVESRSRFEDMPNEREMQRLQEHFADHPAVGYWHDFGHVQLKHHLGLLHHQQWLERISPHLIGCHLHDVQWPKRDHRVPFQGSIDYAPLLQHIDPQLPMVWELSPTRKASDIRAALEQWWKRFPDHG